MKFISFLALPLYTHFLTPADYGAIELVELTIDVLSIVAGSRLLSGVFWLYSRCEDSHQQRRVISTATILITTGYAVVAVAVILGAPSVAALVLGKRSYVNLVRLGAVASVIGAPLMVWLVYLRLRQRFRTALAVQATKTGLQLSLNILLLAVFHLGANGMMLSTAIASMVITSAIGVRILPEVGFAYSRTTAKELYRFGLPLMVTQGATLLLTFGDRPFLRLATDLSSIGRYTFAYQFAFLLANLTQAPFDFAWQPHRFETARRDDRDQIFSRVFVYMSLVVFALATAMCVVIRPVLHLMTTPGFFGAAAFVPILSLAIVFQTLTSIQDTGVLVAERTKLIAYANWIAAGVALVAYAVLIPRYAGTGAAVATVIAYAVRYVLTYAFSQRVWLIRYNWPPVIRLTIISLATVLCSYVAPTRGIARTILWDLSLLTVYGLALWFGGVLSVEDRGRARLYAAAAYSFGHRVLTNLSGVADSRP